MKKLLVITSLVVALFITGCVKFDPFAPISNKQVEKLLVKAKTAHPDRVKSDSCEVLTFDQIKDILATVNKAPQIPVKQREVALLETNLGTLAIAFHVDVAPKHAESFKRLVNAGYFDCTKFHRILKDFVIQGGDILTRDANPSNDGIGGPGYNLPAEFSELPHGPGVVSMARRGDDINSAGSQFFICLTRERTARLDRQYTVFGQVIGGYDVVEKIAALPTGSTPERQEPSVPTEPVYIKRAFMIKR